ncbi:oligopeptide/dipeptide ABC transporter ATP-binding protein [Azorhizobium caulinodans]|uniref:ABC transporter ATP-binding protein n=1 Tax=Azorhizobium caulinodans TaxID=7 RepID=UPI002FBF1A5A
MKAPTSSPPLVEVRDLYRVFDVSKPWLNRVIEREPRRLVRAVDGVSFSIRKGETFALVGESGSGKSTIARMIAGLIPPSRGQILFDGTDISNPANAAEVKRLRRRFQMVFQDPYASLNPRFRVDAIIAEPLTAFGLATDRATVEGRVAELLRLVKLDPSVGRKFPHEFSGGQRQRIAIARALAANPDFIICDEPTSALDVSVQAQVLNLMRDLQDQFGLTYLLITHNLAVVKHMADDVGVLYLGRLGETAPARELFARPRHPYSRMLLEAIPDLSAFGRPRQAVTGEIPNPMSPPSGCTFHPRCPLVEARCRAEVPRSLPAGASLVACHVVAEREAMPLPIG